MACGSFGTQSEHCFQGPNKGSLLEETFLFSVSLAWVCPRACVCTCTWVYAHTLMHSCTCGDQGLMYSVLLPLPPLNIELTARLVGQWALEIHFSLSLIPKFWGYWYLPRCLDNLYGCWSSAFRSLCMHGKQISSMCWLFTLALWDPHWANDSPLWRACLGDALSSVNEFDTANYYQILANYYDIIIIS